MAYTACSKMHRVLAEFGHGKERADLLEHLTNTLQLRGLSLGDDGPVKIADYISQEHILRELSQMSTLIQRCQRLKTEDAEEEEEEEEEDTEEQDNFAKVKDMKEARVLFQTSLEHSEHYFHEASVELQKETAVLCDKLVEDAGAIAPVKKPWSSGLGQEASLEDVLTKAEASVATRAFAERVQKWLLPIPEDLLKGMCGCALPYPSD